MAAKIRSLKITRATMTATIARVIPTVSLIKMFNMGLQRRQIEASILIYR